MNNQAAEAAPLAGARVEDSLTPEETLTAVHGALTVALEGEESHQAHQAGDQRLFLSQSRYSSSSSCPYLRYGLSVPDFPNLHAS